MEELKQDYTIVIVTHNMQQAARVVDRTAFFTAEAAEGTGDRTGELVEFDRHRHDLHQAGRQAHRGLHHRPVRLESGVQTLMGRQLVCRRTKGEASARLQGLIERGLTPQPGRGGER